MSAAFATSACTAMAFLPASLISVTTDSAFAELPAKCTTIAKPSVASLFATTRPIPPDAPVTIATLSVSFLSGAAIL
jgi:hypothetical protein